jgi:kinesin family protein 11
VLSQAYRAKNIKNAPQQNQKLVTAVHLKEYSAEIESLRAQLQITREKNGVYLDPKDFYAMENKIASLTSQLSECEGSLKVRSEEVKLLRVSGDHMELKIQALSQTLEATTMTLNATTLELEDTKRELTATHIELEATECVVTEQAVIESSLRADAQELQQEVTHCRASIINLQEKLDEYAAKQAQSLSRCDGFVEDMSVSHKKLLSSIEALVEDSDKSAALVCDGISVLLTSGRSTCTTLQAAVDRAMNSLVGAVTESGADVTNGLSELRSHVYVSRDGIISQISDLKEELSSAILSMNSSIATVDQLVTEGSTKVGC